MATTDIERSMRFSRALAATTEVMRTTGLGERVREAMRPWERGEILLQGAIAQAILQAYEDGREGRPLANEDGPAVAPATRRRRRR